MSTPWNPSDPDPQQGQGGQQPPAQPNQPSYGQQPPAQPNQPSYGQQPPAQPNQPSYGAPSQPSFGQSSQPSFGQSSQPSFGQPGQQPGQAPGFGQPGQAPGFGQPGATPPGQPPYGGPGGPGGPGSSGPKKNTTPIIIGVIVGVLLIVGIFFAIRALTGGGDEDPTADTTTQGPSEDTAPPEDTTPPEETDTGGDTAIEEISDLDVVPGDCILSLDYYQTNYVMQKVDCATPHQMEIVAEQQTSHADFPDDSEVLENEAATFCQEELGQYYAMVNEDPSVSHYYMWPTQQTWEVGDRKYTCLMIGETEEAFTGSFVNGDVQLN